MKFTTPSAIGLAIVLLACWSGAALLPRSEQPLRMQFKELRMHLEVDLPARWSAGPLGSDKARSLLDLPAEVVLEVAAPQGTDRVHVSDPLGRPVLRLDVPYRTTPGISEIALESEGATLAEVLRAFPPGEYTVEASTLLGPRIGGTTHLSSAFPGLFDVLAPLPGEVLPSDDVRICWTPSRAAARYVLEIEQKALDFSLQVSLPATQTDFTIPVGLLQSGVDYEYSLAVQGDNDNEIEIEGGFVTEGGFGFQAK